MQWEHRTLTGTTDEHEEQRYRHHPCSTSQRTLKLWLSIQVVVEGSYIEAVEQDTDQEEEVGETSYDERLLAGMYCCMLGIIESDEQIRADTHQLPEQIHLENIGSYYQTQHRHGEEAQVSVETLHTLLITLYLVILVTLGHIAE